MKNKKAGPTVPANSDKKKTGRPGHKPTAKAQRQVELLCSVGMTQPEIALIMDMPESTLRRHYVKQLRVGGLKADAKVLTNLMRMAMGSGPEAGRAAIFWAKVRRRWHEVQRVIHGYDPEQIAAFIKSVVSMLRRELPTHCPGCKTKLDLPAKIAAHLYTLSQDMAAQLPASEIVPMPRPELAGDRLDQHTDGFA